MAFARRLMTISLLAICFALPEAGFADPPDWAPAHGWREKDDDHGKSKYKKHKKHKHAHRHDDRGWDDDDYRDRRYSDYEGKDWPSDYGVIRGECDREAIGGVLGGVVGAVVGSRTSNRQDRNVAILLGGVVGAVIGSEIGRRMDERDRACIGHALELSSDGRPVAWRNDYNQAEYVVTPLEIHSREGRPCRQFELRVTVPEQRRDVSRHQACRNADGEWAMAR